jgi:hypothetical protein
MPGRPWAGSGVFEGYGLDILESTGKEKSAFRLDTHEGILDFVRHSVEQSNRWLAAHDLNSISKGYIDGYTEIVIRAVFPNTEHSVYEFVCFSVPVVEESREGERAKSERGGDANNIGAWQCGNRGYYSMFVEVCSIVDCPEKLIPVPSAVRLEIAHERHDIRGDILAPPIADPFDLSGVNREREVCVSWSGDPGALGSGVSAVIQDGSQIVQCAGSKITENIGEFPSESDFELFLSGTRVCLDWLSPVVIIDESAPLRFKITDVRLCAR